jgi:hypothetical protein
LLAKLSKAAFGVEMRLERDVVVFLGLQLCRKAIQYATEKVAS